MLDWDLSGIFDVEQIKDIIIIAGALGPSIVSLNTNKSSSSSSSSS
jgi:hypothetical protein